MTFPTSPTPSRAPAMGKGPLQGGTSDVRVNPLPGPAHRAGVVRKGVEAAATPHAPSAGGHPRVASLPAGEARGSGGKAPRQPCRHSSPGSRVTDSCSTVTGDGVRCTSEPSMFLECSSRGALSGLARGPESTIAMTSATRSRVDQVGSMKVSVAALGGSLL